jgi:hypothetical protein
MVTAEGMNYLFELNYGIHVYSKTHWEHSENGNPLSRVDYHSLVLWNIVFSHKFFSEAISGFSYTYNLGNTAVIINY